MRLVISILLLSCLACLGQAFTMKDTAFLGNAIPPSGTTTFPTNLPNAVSISWWKASDYYTNSGVPTLPDSGPGGFTLTNLTTAGTGTWPTNGGTLNGQTLLRFGTAALNTRYLCSDNYTSPQPHTVCLVVYIDDDGDISKFFFSSTNSGGQNSWVEAGGTASSPKKIRLNAGNPYDTWTDTNTWILSECLFNGAAASRQWTNGVASAAAGNAGTESCGGFTLGAAYGKNAGAYFLLGEVMTYSTALTPADRTALYNYVKNKYGAANFYP